MVFHNDLQQQEQLKGGHCNNARVQQQNMSSNNSQIDK